MMSRRLTGGELGSLLTIFSKARIAALAKKLCRLAFDKVAALFPIASESSIIEDIELMSEKQPIRVVRQKRLDTALKETVRREFVPILRAMREVEKKLDYVVQVIDASRKDVESQIGRVSGAPEQKNLEPYFKKFKEAAEAKFGKPVLLDRKYAVTHIVVDGKIYGAIDNEIGAIYKVRSFKTGLAQRYKVFGNITDEWYGWVDLTANGWKTKTSIA